MNPPDAPRPRRRWETRLTLLAVATVAVGYLAFIIFVLVKSRN